MSPVAAAAHDAFQRMRGVAMALRRSRSPFALAAFSIEAADDITEAVDALILARLKERDEQWIMFLKEAMAANGIELLQPPGTT